MSLKKRFCRCQSLEEALIKDIGSWHVISGGYYETVIVLWSQIWHRFPYQQDTFLLSYYIQNNNDNKKNLKIESRFESHLVMTEDGFPFAIWLWLFLNVERSKIRSTADIVELLMRSTSPRGVIMRRRVEMMTRTQSVCACMKGWREARQTKLWWKANWRPSTQFIELQYAWPGHDFKRQVYLFTRWFSGFAFLIRRCWCTCFLVWFSLPFRLASFWLVLVPWVLHLVLFCESSRFLYIRFFVLLREFSPCCT